MKNSKHQKRALRIAAETIRVLERETLGRVAGGIGTDMCTSGNINSVCCQQ